MVYQDGTSSDAPVWSQISCGGQDVWVTSQYTDLASREGEGAYYSLSSSIDSGRTLTTLVSQTQTETGSQVPNQAAVTDLAQASGSGSFFIGFPPTGWELQVTPLSGAGLGKSTDITDLPRIADSAQDARLYLLIQGAESLGDQGWILLTDNAVGTDESQESQQILLYTNDAASSWQILNMGKLLSPPNLEK
jgi:hypothetical protein